MTPMMQQYKDIKAQNPDCFLFFRLGDFYELFFDDALKASALLNITLTKRGRDESEAIPMCGVPFHAADSYIARLVKEGHSVALCDQVEDVGEAKKRGAKSIVKRAVVRIITPGTLTEDNLLDAKVNNFLMVLAPSHKNENVGVSLIDISTGLILVDTFTLHELAHILQRFNPREVVTTPRGFQHMTAQESLKEWLPKVKTLPEVRFDASNASRRLLTAFKVKTLDGLVALNDGETQSLGVLLDFVELTQVGVLPRLNIPRKIKVTPILEIDAATQKNLELFTTLSGDTEKSLLSYLDDTQTAAGARLIRLYLASPLSLPEAINERLNHVDYFFQHHPVLSKVRSRLSAFPDLDRALSRLSLGRGSPRDLGMIRDAIECIERLNEDVQSDDTPQETRALYAYDAELIELKTMLNSALADHMPLLARDGDFVRLGFHAELDEVRALRDQGRQKIAEVQARYAHELGISSLKIKHNNVLGYHIEVTNTHLTKIPDYFVHRQTTANTARYTTVDLTELEQRLSEAAHQALQIELALFEELSKAVAMAGEALSSMAHRIAMLDVFSTFATIAHRYGYVRPTIDGSVAFDIKGGRHPVIERALQNEDGKAFKPNDCRLESDQLLWLITGPNMAGKSTFLRQNALIVIMGQMGCYVPAHSAHFGAIDRLFSRVGASDDLARGHSTFMVEMVETALILNNATPRSLVILDEVGRGTSTHDGLSIAWAVIEYLHNRLQCRGLFATHYHELTNLGTKLTHLFCATMRVKEWHNKVIFMHEMLPGVADKSYGIHVAEMAGVPLSVIERAYELLETLSKKQPLQQSVAELPLFAEQSQTLTQVKSHKKDHDMIEALRAMALDDLTPKEALNFLYEWKKRFEEEREVA